MSIRLRFALPLVLALGLLATGGPARGTAQDDVTIRYFTFSAAPDHLDALDAMIAAFEAANPGISVEVIRRPTTSTSPSSRR